jgi:CheY-like chemotaxis protein
MSEPQKVIVVDDEARICQSFERALNKQGYAVESFTSAPAALDRLEKGDVDLVVSDLMMPEMTGLDLLKAMRDKGIGTHLIMITGYAHVENALESMRLGAIDYLPKPFTLAELKAVVARGLCAGNVDPGQLPAPPKGSHEIPNHSWVRTDDTGDVLVGVHPFVLQCCGKITEIELPVEEDELVQGGAFGKIIVESDRVPIRLWSPVSGHIKENNTRAVENPSMIKDDPYGEGWLLKVSPSNLQEDLKPLVART